MQLELQKSFDVPNLLAGPCSLVVGFGGTAAVSGMGSLTFGCVPAEWFPTTP